MAASSSRVEEDCSPPSDRDVDVGVVLGDWQSPRSSITDMYGMSDEFFATCESATAAAAAAGERKCGDNDHLAIVEVGQRVKSNADYSSDGGNSGKSEGSSSDYKMSTTLVNRIKSWCETTGLPADITVHFKSRTFQLHKAALVSRSGYIQRMLMKEDSEVVVIPNQCPGNPEIFDIVATFCYGSAIRLESSNVADLRCAAEFLQMGEEHGKANLCERSDSYLNQVALQSWQDTMVVLLHCPSLLPYAEDLGIMDRCVECLAFLACIEMMDPVEKTTSRHHGPSSIIESQFWSDISVSTKDTSTTTTTDSSPSPDWWMDDLLRLPCVLFERVIAAIRSEGMQEKFVSQAIVKFVDRWVFNGSRSPDAETEKALVRIEEVRFTQAESFGSFPSAMSVFGHENLVESVVRLLPEEKDAVPISFLFSLLRSALACKSSSECRSLLESKIACQLELATIADFLYPFKAAEDEGGGCSISAVEVSCMRRIVDLFMSQQRSLSDYPSEAVSGHDAAVPDENFYCAYSVSAVAKVWDEYLGEVARDRSLTPAKFAELAEVVPSYARATHDHLYKAIHVYLKMHPHFTQDERQMVCGILNCQKLSPEMCSHAVQNELMPLRMIVQAMFVQQLQTRNVLSGHLQFSGLGQSSRFDSGPQGSGGPVAASWRRISVGHRISTTTDSFRSSRESFRSRQHDYFRDESFGAEDDDLDEEPTSAPLGFMMRREAAFRQAALLKADYLATETRLQNLEEELAFMKKKMGGSKQQQERQHPVSKCTSERFSTVSSRRRTKENLTAVPEAITTNSDAEDHDGDDGGNVKFSARTGNGLGFLTRALRLITLGFGRRKSSPSGGTDGDGAADGGPAYSAHVLCGAKGIWETHNDDSIIVVKSKRGEGRAAASTLNSMVAHGSGLCGASSKPVRARHNRRHSLS